VERPEADALIQQLEGELDQAAIEQEEIGQRIRGYEQTLEGLCTLFPDLRQTDRESVVRRMARAIGAQQRHSMTPTEAVLAVLMDPQFEQRVWTVRQMTDEVVRRNWAPDTSDPANSVRASLGRLVNDHHSVYRVTAASDPQQRYAYQPATEEVRQAELAQLNASLAAREVWPS
jgi:hypothetical protein